MPTEYALNGSKMAEATVPREFWAVLDRDDKGDVYTSAERAREDAEIWNASRTASVAAQRPYRVVRLREVTA